MSRVAKNPIDLRNTDVTLEGQILTIQGKQGVLSYSLDKRVGLTLEKEILRVYPLDDSKEADALAGTTRANLQNGIIGVAEGFKKVLQLIGVGYRASVNVPAKTIDLTLGFSHPVVYHIPAGITVSTPTQTEIVIQGSDKQLVGQVAAEIRRYRPPEPYKGKGIRYLGERIKLKQTKKK